MPGLRNASRLAMQSLYESPFSLRSFSYFVHVSSVKIWNGKLRKVLFKACVFQFSGWNFCCVCVKTYNILLGDLILDCNIY